MKYILIQRIKVQNANTIAGFTWGFPAITHFLGFTHHLTRKLVETRFRDIHLKGCAVVCHHHQVHIYGSRYHIQFSQNRNPAYLKKDINKLVSEGKTPSVIEEGKMNMTVSLLIGCEGNIGNRINNFKDWLDKQCKLQRLAGGTVLSIEDIDIFNDDDADSLRQIKFKLLPGFMLMDRSVDLENHYHALQKNDPDAELLDAWLDFAAIKQKARPKSDLISKHLFGLEKGDPDHSQFIDLQDIWNKHLESPYDASDIPVELKDHFAGLENTGSNKALLQQWHNYCEPIDTTPADWEYIPKPATGYLVPIMTGYKAISRIYANHEVESARDNETDVCFVESVHSVGEWRSVHRLKSSQDLRSSLWRYFYEDNWYLCHQDVQSEDDSHVEAIAEYEEDFD